MPEDDLQIFAPRPKRRRFLIGGREVLVDIYNWQDRPVKEALAFWTLEEEMRAAIPKGWPVLIDYLQKLVALICPTLESDHLEAMTPQQLQDAIGVSHSVTLPPPGAEGDAGAASPSPSAASTTPSP